jgi:hypothetical protein
VEADLPTVRVTLRTEHGAAPATTRIWIDGAAVQSGALSAPIVLEAGPHEVRVEAPGYQAVRLQKALRPSDREVPVVVTLRPPEAPRQDGQGGVPTASWVLAGVGALALGGAVYFGVTANDEYQELKQSCAPACEPSASDGMHQKAVIADIALASSVVAFAASAILYFTRGTKPVASARSAEPPTPRVRLTF